MELFTLGTIHTPYKAANEAPRQGRFAEELGRIELKPEYKDALLHVKEGEYYVVLYFAHQANRNALQTIPPWAGESYGVFASRSPHRPNPINIDVVKLIKLEDTVLTVQGLDALDGSLLVDMKPYVPDIDEVEEA